MSDLLIRDARSDDLPALTAIYDHWILTSDAIFLDEPVGSQVMADKLAAMGPPDRFLVAEAEGRVVGFAASGPHRPRPLYDVRELSVYLAPDVAGRGVGRALYDRLIAHADASGVHSLVGVVALPNAASEALHRAVGFERVGVLRELGHKGGRRIDVALWQRMNPLPH